jgi:AraC-like DNA-binding protein
VTHIEAAYPHHAWLAHQLIIRPPRLFNSVRQRRVTHHLLLTTAGDADIHCETNGVETRFHAEVGVLGWFPCDREDHIMSITAANGYAAYEVSIPVEQVPQRDSGDGKPATSRFQPTPLFRDSLIEAGLFRLTAQREGQQVSESIGDEVAARQILTRLCAMLGSTAPRWPNDASIFTPCLMRLIVGRIDTALAGQVPLEVLAREFGLSPGHFARKFRHSTGLSLQRFLNQRRIGRSCGMLREGSLSLARIAIELGFSSQSHFTRLFSGLTGTSPQRFRRLQQRMGE